MRTDREAMRWNANPQMTAVAPLVAVLLLCTSSTTAPADVVTDGSVGSQGSVLVPTGTDPFGQAADFLIGPEFGTQSGGNLFHSFSDFDIGVSEIATFTGPDPVSGPQSVSNIISRITSGSQSDVFGTVRSTINGANLFLLNPDGFAFGRDAAIDVSGSFHASSAAALRFADGNDFDATSALPVEATALSSAGLALWIFSGSGPVPFVAALIAQSIFAGSLRRRVHWWSGHRPLLALRHHRRSRQFRLEEISEDPGAVVAKRVDQGGR